MGKDPLLPPALDPNLQETLRNASGTLSRTAVRRNREDVNGSSLNSYLIVYNVGEILARGPKLTAPKPGKKIRNLRSTFSINAPILIGRQLLSLKSCSPSHCLAFSPFSCRESRFFLLNENQKLELIHSHWPDKNPPLPSKTSPPDRAVPWLRTNDSIC
jgi:hypothetical protein